MNLSDAHCHLQDPRLTPLLKDVLRQCRAVGINRWMVNATREADWEAVVNLAGEESGIHISLGLHPWWQSERSDFWKERLEDLLLANPKAAIGETGLDQWMQGHDLKGQCAVLMGHLELSRRLDRPITLHCLRAWPELERCLERHPPSERGFLLHSYSGPAERISYWAERGAYFSFSPAFLHPNKEARRRAFEQVPMDRLLIETDAPDMSPPGNLTQYPLATPGGAPVNHPANLRLCLAFFAEKSGCTEEQMALVLERNGGSLFFTQ